jgi:lysozyme
MTVSTTKKVVTGAGTAAVIAATVAFLPNWEGMKTVASRDKIGTGHPVDYCYGQTDEFGTVKVGTRFTKKQCDENLAESLPHYLALIEPCIKVALPVKTKASLLDASYNAGPAAICRSPMVAKMNAGDLRGGCNAFKGWYVRSDGVERRGLVARRSGIGDGRKSERDLCLEGVAEGLPRPSVQVVEAAPLPKRWWQK